MQNVEGSSAGVKPSIVTAKTAAQTRLVATHCPFMSPHNSQYTCPFENVITGYELNVGAACVIILNKQHLHCFLFCSFFFFFF